MKRREFVWSALSGTVGLAAVRRASAQGTAFAPNLATLAETKRLTLINRGASSLVDGTRHGVRLDAGRGEGLAFLPGFEFRYGTIACDIRGKDVAQQSFVGVAFHGDGAAAYDGVYFRPFNFRAADPVSRSHAVQYHSPPLYTWQKLRAERPGQYEQAVTPVPDPNDWFHARIVITDPTVSVFIGDAKTPCLVVRLLNDRRQGMVGLWAGNSSGGDFANLTITPAAG